MSVGQRLLQMTGNIWKVCCYRDGNRRRPGPTIYVRAELIIRAEEIARSESGCKCVDASPWNPLADRKSCSYVGVAN